MNDEATELRPAATPTPRHRALDTRFTPGAVVAGRYRIVSLLGTGGMGEVYRADDLKLGQRVALKYVPEALAHDPAVLERLYEEVRIGRQISHPNVCRLYDIVEAEGQRFIAMEFVDGEDLASLLRRIGRLPSDKALAVARDVCAGLAAAHDVGFIHRDLKPANVMIDSRGTARVADFGLAAAVEDEIRDGAGTPAYMAPEQLAGHPPSKRSDIYALGVLLYEMFTGRRLFSGRTLDEIREQHASSKTRPSSIIAEIEPAVERVILRCLEEDPTLRPPSIGAVVHALPGGDPLQAAIAAGETPSPELVAAAGEAGDVSVARAWTLFALAIVFTILAVALTHRGLVPWVASEVKSPAVLTDRAQTIIQHMQAGGGAADSHGWYQTNSDYVRQVLGNRLFVRTIEPFRHTPPAPVAYRYRESPVPLIAWHADAIATSADPPENVGGMTSVVVDQAGRLRLFRRTPLQRDARAPGTIDWSVAFRDAGLDFSRFRAVAPQWTPPVGSDARYAWTGAYTERPDIGIRVEASSTNNRPTWFAVIEPWKKPERAGAAPSDGQSALAILLFIAITMSSIFARRNWVRGRGDKRGAMRIAVVMAVVTFAGSLMIAHHTAVVSAEWEILTSLAGLALFDALCVWLFYLSIEPYVRLHSPYMLVSWTRLLAGRIRDPLVGRDLLTGVIFGALADAAIRADVLLFYPLSLNPFVRPTFFTSLGGLHAVFASLRGGILHGLGLLIVFVFLRRLLRRDIFAFVLTVLIVATVNLSASVGLLPSYIDGIVGITIMTIALWRSGILAGATAVFVQSLLLTTIVTLDLRQWYAGPEIVALVVVLALAAFGFITSLAGKPIFGATLVEHGAPA